MVIEEFTFFFVVKAGTSIQNVSTDCTRKKVCRCCTKDRSATKQQSGERPFFTSLDQIVCGQWILCPTLFLMAENLERYQLLMSSRENVVNALEKIVQQRGTPKQIRCDNGPEFISRVLDKWCYEKGVELHFSRKGRPTDNAYVESFNGKFRDECLSFHWFMSLDDAREKIEAWRWEYNDRRPHYSLNFKTPSEFAFHAGLEELKKETEPKSLN